MTDRSKGRFAEILSGDLVAAPRTNSVSTGNQWILEHRLGSAGLDHIQVNRNGQAVAVVVKDIDDPERHKLQGATDQRSGVVSLVGSLHFRDRTHKHVVRAHFARKADGFLPTNRLKIQRKDIAPATRFTRQPNDLLLDFPRCQGEFLGLMMFIGGS